MADTVGYSYEYEFPARKTKTNLVMRYCIDTDRLMVLCAKL